MNPAGWHFLELPIVPPLAACYKNAARVGRVKTKRYKEWQISAIDEINFIVTHDIPDEPLAMCHVKLTLPYIANGDMDNRFKGTMDILKAAGWIVDDNMKCVRKIEATWSRGVPRDRMIVSIKEVTDGEVSSGTYPG